MRKFLMLLFVIVTNYTFSQNKIEKINDFAKVYSTVRYFYPEPQLNKFDWNNFLIYNTNMFLQDSLYDYTESIKQIAPLSFFSDTLTVSDSIDNSELKSYYYWQHRNRVSDKKNYNKSYSNDIVNDFSRNNYDLWTNLNVKNALYDSIKIEFKAKLNAKNVNNAFIKLKAYSFKEQKYIYKKKIEIENSETWKKYEIKDVFCADCINEHTTYLLIGNHTDSILYIDSIIITNITNDSIIYADYFENNVPSKYGSSIFYDCNNKDKVLKVSKRTAFRQQENLSKNITINLENTYFTIPRFINTTEKIKPNLFDLNIKMTRIDSLKAIRMADLIYLYTTVYNNYPYIEIRDKINIETLFKECIHNFLKNKNYTLEEHIYNISFFMSAFKDAHTQIIYPPKGNLPFRIEKYGNKYIVSNVFNKKYSNFLGKEVLKINDVKIENYIKSKLSIYADINLPIWNDLLLYKRFSNNPLKIDFKNKSILINDFNNKYHYKNDVIKDTSFTLLKEQAAFFSYSQRAKVNSLEIKNKIDASQYIIIDCRLYKQKVAPIDEFFILMTHINGLKTKTLSSLFQSPFYKSTELDTSIRYGGIISNLNPNLDTNKFKAKRIYALVDKNTLSHKEAIILTLYENDLITLIGQKTAGSTGHITYEKLISDIVVYFTAGYGIWSDGTPYQNTGMKPKYYIKPKYKKKLSLKNDRDFLKAKQLIRKQILIDKKN